MRLMVTILILIDGFLQYLYGTSCCLLIFCHNPYFNRWFSAITKVRLQTEVVKSHNPYFNRWFSAIIYDSISK